MNKKFIPLYRKYRPKILEEIVGQEHIKKALANAINLNKITHAYLFTGPRGTGKTSTARILAKSLNCENGPTVTPCGKCASCIDISNSTPLDVIEIDAASNRSVNDAQNILEKIQYAPVNGKYKIYIIDEVHMLTVQAFNALLKTLEEPPENVVFILATTEVHKVLDTIKSRCQRFDFKRITTEDIAKHLKHIAELENINIEDDAILTIAKNAAGGMRDSLALLDQLSVLDTEKAINTEDINSLLGRLSFDVLNKLSEAIIKSNPNEAIEILEQIYSSGNEPSQILVNLLDYFKNLLVVKNCKTELLTELTGTTESQVAELKKQADKLETQQIVFLIERTSHYVNELKTTTNQHTWLEVAMIDLANLTENTKLIDLQNRLTKLESGEITTSSAVSYKTPPSPIQKPAMKPSGFTQSTKPIEFLQKHEQKVNDLHTPKPENAVQNENQNTSENNTISEHVNKVVTNDSNDINELWKTLVNNIGNPNVQRLVIQQAKPVKITPEETILTSNQIWTKGLNEDSRKNEIIKALDAMFGQTNSSVIVRLPQASDKQIVTTVISHQDVQQKEPSSSKNAEINLISEKNIEEKTPRPTEDNNFDESSESKKLSEVTEQNNQIETTKISSSEFQKSSDLDMLSDQAKMVKDLFEGKVVE